MNLNFNLGESIYGAGFSSDTTGVGERWWELFGDTTLDALVEQALANNRDVAVAAARVQQARANLKTVRAQYLPQIGAEATAEGEYTPETEIVQSYAVEPTLSWELSLFGALRNVKRAAKAEIAASEWALAGVRLSLAAEVATTYFTLLEYERDLSIARQTLVTVDAVTRNWPMRCSPKTLNGTPRFWSRRTSSTVADL